ncbi:MAG: hypothetical protein WC476_13370 [Phycisphaerae bacterium]|jgi:hypothetical protein
MSELKFLWLGLNSSKEKEVFLEGFWAGIAATELMRKEAEQLEREIEGAKGTIQQIATEI